ncbi:MAG: TraB/GumN family protein [Gammaproteobacteria bacterium]|nr:TraB/GumN family protein [Gammaproteobacteria bacterium]
MAGDRFSGRWGSLVLGALLVAPAVSHALPLWELSGTPNRVMVLGSIHFLRAADYPLAAPITAALEAADVVFMEIDMDDQDPAASAGAVASLARDPGGRTLAELLGPAAWASAASEARKLGLDLQPLMPFEPWYAAVAVTQVRLGQLGFDPALGVEAKLTADARRLHKEIRGLETLEDQLGMLDGLSPDAQRAFLRATIEDAAEVGDIAGDMIAAWKTGDARALEGDLLDGVRDQPEVYRKLIVRRNEHFATTIRELEGTGRNYLVVVGALHLVGPDSVLRILEKAGIKARQIEPPRAAD